MLITQKECKQLIMTSKRVRLQLRETMKENELKVKKKNHKKINICAILLNNNKGWEGVTKGHLWWIIKVGRRDTQRWLELQPWMSE